MTVEEVSAMAKIEDVENTFDKLFQYLISKHYANSDLNSLEINRWNIFAHPLFLTRYRCIPY